MTSLTSPLPISQPHTLETHGGRAYKALAWLRRCLAVAAERRELRQLDARALGDIGVDPIAACQEAYRPFWDLPEMGKDRH